MSRTPAPDPREDGPRSLSSLLRALDGAPTGAAPGVDLAAAVRDGGRRRRRRRAAGAGAALVAVTAVLALGAGWVGPAPTGPVTPAATAASVTGSTDGPTADDLLDSGWSELSPGQLETPGVSDDRQPAVWLDPGRSELAVVVDTGGCWEENTLEVVSQSAGLLELRYVDQDGPTACAYVAVVATYELSLSAPLAEGAAVVLELPDARTDSPDGLSGIATSELDPGEVAVGAPQVVMPARGTSADGSSWNQLFTDVTGTRLRLRFAFSICATAVIRPPVVDETQVRLDVVVTDPGRGCVQPFYSEDFLVPLDAPLGDRRVVVTEENRTLRSSGDGGPTSGVVGRDVSALDPDEVEVPRDQLLPSASRTQADGRSKDRVFVDATGTRLRLQFTVSACAELTIPEPQEEPTRVVLGVVVTMPRSSWGCTAEVFHADDLLITLDAPLGDRLVAIDEERRWVEGQP